jgi:DNA mismatch repair protein MutS2
MNENNELKYCKLKNSNRIYTVEKTTDKKVYLRFANSVITTDIQNIEFVNSNEVTKKKSTHTIKLETTDVPREIMLRHKLKETALSELDKYIDQAMLLKLGRVRIIHGKHGGVLRNAVHEYLSAHPYVKEFHIADYTEGGLGVTIAILGKKTTKNK